jgi:hypothetical protein
MKRIAVAAGSLSLLILFAFLHVAAAAPNEREKWIAGRWTSETEGRPDRIVVFHRDHSWGVEHDWGEDIRGRRWHLAGGKLVLRFPRDHGFETYEEKIVSFNHDKIVTDISTYTREK